MSPRRRYRDADAGTAADASATLLRAWRLLAEDPVLEVQRLYPNAKVDEAQAANWHASLGGAWARHTGG